MSFNNTYPRPSTISARCLARMLLGERLSHRDGDNATGSYRLAGLVHYLEQVHGWPIARTTIIEDSKDPAGRKAEYTEYWLEEALIQWIGEEGQDYGREVLALETKRIAERLAATSYPANVIPSRTDGPDRNTESKTQTNEVESDDEPA